jgi:group I intron endonuclease
MQLNSGVYKIINIQNGNFYIGSSTNLSLRKKSHFNKLKRNKHVNTYLQNVYLKYGEELLKFQVLATCPSEYCIKLEQWFLNNLKPKYNILKIAGNSLGYKHTEQTKKKLSIIHKNKIFTKEHWSNFREGSKKSFENRYSDYKKVADLIKEGKSQKEICNILNKTRQEFWLLKSQAINKGVLVKQKSKKEMFILMYKEGKTRIEIMNLLNLDSLSYRNYKHKYIKNEL